MIFTYNHKKSKYFFSILYVFSFLFITTSSLAMQKIVSLNPITGSELTMILKQNQLDSQFKITPTHEVVAEINQIRSSKKARLQLRESLNRMQKYSPAIIQQLKEEKLPNDLLAMPLIQSGYRPLDENKNPVKAAGIWQIVPTTAKNLGLNINHENDERLNTTLSTKAALTYLKNLYNQFHDWKLAVCAYEYGEDTIEQLINVVGSRDAWTIARSIHAPKTLKHYLAKFDSAVIIMHNPSLQT